MEIEKISKTLSTSDDGDVRMNFEAIEVVV